MMHVGPILYAHVTFPPVWRDGNHLFGFAFDECVCETSVFVYVECLSLLTGPATHRPNRELQSPLIK